MISSTSFAFTLSSITVLDLPSRLLHSPIRNIARPETCVFVLVPAEKYPFPLLHVALLYPLTLLAISSLEHSGNRTKGNAEDKSIVPFPTTLMGTTLLSPALCWKAACDKNPRQYEQEQGRTEYECVCFSCWCSANHVIRNHLTTGPVKTSTPIFAFTLNFKAFELCKRCFWKSKTSTVLCLYVGNGEGRYTTGMPSPLAEPVCPREPSCLDSELLIMCQEPVLVSEPCTLGEGLSSQPCN